MKHPSYTAIANRYWKIPTGDAAYLASLPENVQRAWRVLKVLQGRKESALQNEIFVDIVAACKVPT